MRYRNLRKLDDFYDLLPKVLAAQQPKEPFGHALDPIQHIFLEFDLSRVLPIGKPLQGFISSVPPVECKKSMDAGPRDDEVTHEPFTNVRLAELPSKSDAAANHNASTRPEVFLDCVIYTKGVEIGEVARRGVGEVVGQDVAES